MLALLAALGGPIAGIFVKGPSERLSKIVGGAAAVFLVLALLGLGKCAYDRNLIAQHDATRDAQIANATVGADRAADAAAANRTQAFQNSQAVLENAAAGAKAADPQGAAKPVGPVSKSYYDNLPDSKGKKK
jgi:predicted lipid-binding transport protein (Tim44 family)